MSLRRVWRVALASPLAAGVVYFLTLRLIAPQDAYCDRTAQTFPWYGGADLNGWGAIGLGLIALAGAVVLVESRRSGLTRSHRALAAVAALAIAAALVSVAYLVPYIHYWCGE